MSFAKHNIPIYDKQLKQPFRNLAAIALRQHYIWTSILFVRDTIERWEKIAAEQSQIPSILILLPIFLGSGVFKGEQSLPPCLQLLTVLQFNFSLWTSQLCMTFTAMKCVSSANQHLTAICVF